MIATASFRMPSPKIIENNLGCSSYLMIEIAAITSEEHRSDPMSRELIKLNSRVLGGLDS